jgi:hypothetical protein
MRQAKKAKYRVRNWHEYNRAVVEGGSLSVWIETGIAQG